MPFQSFRDPASSVEVHDSYVVRRVRPEAEAIIQFLLQSPAIQREIQDGGLARAERVAPHSSPLVLKHEKISPISYPHEWPPTLLQLAGKHILHMAQLAMDLGLRLKDATPYNVLFRGIKPVFVDWTSFEFENKESPDPTWRPLSQFVSTVLLPLLVWRATGFWPHMFFLQRREGITPEEAAGGTPIYKRLHGSSFRYITLPSILGRYAKPTLYHDISSSSPEKALFIVRHLLQRLRKDLESVKTAERTSEGWTGYMKDGSAYSYSEEAFQCKESLVKTVLSKIRPKGVLDIGCNTGYFSILAQKTTGTQIVAIDQDGAAVDSLAARAAREDLSILPLHVSISNPTPAIGWENLEFPSFLQRMENQFDLVMMLAVIHHLEVTERVPLCHVLNMCSRLSRRYALIEFVSREDDMFKQLLKGRDALHTYWNKEYFESVARKRFITELILPIKGSSRILYLLKKP